MEEKHIEKVEVCCGGTCLAQGSQDIFDTLQSKFENVEMCSCLGRCKKGPNVLIDEKEIFHYSKPHTVNSKICYETGDIYKRFSEDDITDNFLEDI